jgi:hypothetical protein
MMFEICCITVQDRLLFHRVTPGFSLSMPAQDVSPKVRKSQEVMAGFEGERRAGV